MSDNLKKEVTPEQQPEKKKDSLAGYKDRDEPEETMALIASFVRLGILVWSGSILTLAYIKLPAKLGIPDQNLDPTFIASVFTGVLATFGVQTAGKKQSHGYLTPEQMEILLERIDRKNNAKTD